MQYDITDAQIDGARPLQGVRVIEFCWIWAGPLMGEFLADLGAEVIKIETESRFDPYRTRGIERRRSEMPKHVWRESSPSFHSLNRNKISLAVDLKKDRGIDVVKELVAASDVVINNFTTGTLERLGLGYEVLSSLNRDIVNIGLNGFREDTPLANMRAYGLVLSALAGIEAEIKDENGNFLGSPTFVVSDPNAAVFGLLAAVAALCRRAEVGGGCDVGVSQLEAAQTLASDMGAEFAESSRGSWSSIIPVAGEDRYVAVCLPDTVGDQEVDSWHGAPSDELIAKASELGGAAVPVNSLQEAFEHEVYADCPMGVGSSHPITGPEQIVGSPWREFGRRAAVQKPAPTLGEGTMYVLHRVLGLTYEEIDELVAENVVMSQF